MSKEKPVHIDTNKAQEMISSWSEADENTIQGSIPKGCPGGDITITFRFETRNEAASLVSGLFPIASPVRILPDCSRPDKTYPICGICQFNSDGSKIFYHP